MVFGLLCSTLVTTLSIQVQPLSCPESGGRWHDLISMAEMLGNGDRCLLGWQWQLYFAGLDAVGSAEVHEGGRLQEIRCIRHVGMVPQDTRHLRRNRFYKSAMHVAMEYPELAVLMEEGSKSGSSTVEGINSLLPATRQVRTLACLWKTDLAEIAL